MCCVITQIARPFSFLAHYVKFPSNIGCTFLPIPEPICSLPSPPFPYQFSSFVFPHFSHLSISRTIPTTIFSSLLLPPFGPSASLSRLGSLSIPIVSRADVLSFCPSPRMRFIACLHINGLERYYRGRGRWKRASRSWWMEDGRRLWSASKEAVQSVMQDIGTFSSDCLELYIYSNVCLVLCELCPIAIRIDTSM